MRFWVRDPDSLDWRPIEAEGSAFALLSVPRAPVVPLSSGSPLPPASVALLLRRFSPFGSGPAALILLCQPSAAARVNGVPVSTGIRLVSDRDAIALGSGSPLFVSTDAQPLLAPFPAADRPCLCPRCSTVLEADTPACRCPNCGQWMHASDVLPCWSGFPSCLCGFPSASDAGRGWSPAEL